MLVQLIVKMWPPILLMPDKFPLVLGDLKGKNFFLLLNWYRIIV